MTVSKLNTRGIKLNTIGQRTQLQDEVNKNGTKTCHEMWTVLKTVLKDIEINTECDAWAMTEFFKMEQFMC